jgi:predicted DNA-binding transcriptional regulator YafY
VSPLVDARQTSECEAHSNLTRQSVELEACDVAELERHLVAVRREQHTASRDRIETDDACLADTDDGGCELSMRVGGIKEVRAWVLGWGGDVEVLAPPALRDEVRDHARRMVERYAGAA